MEFIRCGFVGFGDSSLDFELEFDSPHTDFQSMYDARHLIGMAILDCFNAEGIEFAYPTQTSFTAAPDGTMIMPYPDQVELEARRLPASLLRAARCPIAGGWTKQSINSPSRMR